jgi:hypothetical protein
MTSKMHLCRRTKRFRHTKHKIHHRVPMDPPRFTTVAESYVAAEKLHRR